MKTKQLSLLLLAALLLVTVTSPLAGASSLLTSTEKESRYADAIVNLEAYIESCGENGISLTGIENMFDQLGGYEQSRPLMYYTQVLIKLETDAYDYDLDMLLEILNENTRFKAYLRDALKGSAIGSIESLKMYTAGRHHEFLEETALAIASYKSCLGFFDADDRYRRLRAGQDAAAYDKAMAAFEEGDFAGAYYLFTEANHYRDSDTRRQAITVFLGYTPESETDNLQPVAGIYAARNENLVTLSWHNVAHAEKYTVSYRVIGDSEWISRDTDTNSIVYDLLDPEKEYEFQITAASGSVTAKSVVLKLAVSEILNAEFEIVDGHAVLMRYLGDEEDVIIPETWNGCRITAINEGAFRNCDKLTSVVLADGITSIGDFAFQECSALSAVEMADTVRSFGDGAFYACGSLKAIKIPAEVTEIGKGAFCACSSLTEVAVPEGVLSIEENTFSLCSSLKSLILPGTLQTIGGYAFQECSGLTDIVIPDSVRSIGPYAFRKCSGLESVTMPRGVVDIGQYAFSRCTRLGSIVIPDTVMTVGDHAFWQDESLTDVTILDGVASIGYGAFSECGELKKLSVPASVLTIGKSAFEGCPNLIVSVKKGSPAEKYCQENQVRYVSN